MTWIGDRMACCKKIYTVPKFPLTGQVWTGGMAGMPIGPRFLTPCQLVYGDLDSDLGLLPTFNTLAGKLMYLLVPKLTDLQTVICGPLVFNDYINLPFGTLRFYQIMHVDDRWKGFPTEHRVAVLQQSLGPAGAGWGAPIQ